MIQYIIVSRQTGELYTGYNHCRFYDSVSSAQGCANLNTCTILEITIGAEIKAAQVARYSRTKKEFYDGIDEELAKAQEHLDWCLNERDCNDSWMQHLIKEDRERIEMLNDLRYENLVYK